MKVLTALFLNLVMVGNAFAMAGQPGGGKEGGGGIVGMLLPMVVVFAIFYLLLIRPQQKQQKKIKAMLDAVQKGDQVLTRGGIQGKVTGIAEGIITLEIAENVKVKISREYISLVLGKETATK